MPNNFTLILDTVGPANPGIVIEGGAQYATQQLVDVAISTSDGNTAGYTMKIWGVVDAAYDTDVKETEGESAWITLQSTKQIKLAAGDGNKTLYVRIRDDVHNQSGQASDSITLDTTKPVVAISGPDVTKISKQTGKDTSAFSFQVDTAFIEYKVKVVSSTGAAHDTGTQIPTVGGSTNMSGSESFAANTPISCTIKGVDLETASPGDGSKIIKVFAKDAAGNWSV